MRKIVSRGIVIGIGYIAFMLSVDVPMYFSRWNAEEAAGKAYLSIAQGFADASSRWVASGTIESWGPEMPWMTLYFSVAVWLSVAVVRARD